MFPVDTVLAIFGPIRFLLQISPDHLYEVSKLSNYFELLSTMETS
jgi:hypothetical protein